MSIADRIEDPWGARTPYGPGDSWPVRVDEHTVEQPERWMQSASLLHSNGDGIDIGVRAGRIVGVRGRATDRVNRGRLDPKDVYGWQANASPDRLTRPLVRGGDRLVEAGWDETINRIVSRSKPLLAEPGGWGRFGFYTTGQLFLEKYYTLAVIGKAGLGTPPHGRQHPAVHRHVGVGAQGQLRHRRSTRLLHRRGPLRRDRAVGAQRRRHADGALDADAGPAPRGEPAGDARRRPTAHAGRPRGRRAPAHPARHEPRPDERPTAADPPQRLGRRGLPRRAHARPR